MAVAVAVAVIVAATALDEDERLDCTTVTVLVEVTVTALDVCATNGVENEPWLDGEAAGAELGSSTVAGA